MVKLMQDRLVETFADAVGLRMTRLGSGMFNTVHTKAKLVVMRFQFAAVFRVSIRQNTDNSHLL